ncbi:hypothetical protein CcCBS67573_g00365 [Chytriomyces confervae]|uniref:Late embryogenesis abundant protein LEA-2 subgroup domain-containing protein n=1 Tax=Chytriomyces confervae TaxID=246404 RepID=A0A507FPZ0_9FUNG|nr:hypothetical protein HDU80_006801 [Chytriomyces hyalinus]TPX78342.1 hypothetical protein CcCBS67573_g00365 [Chytriomyces confervae]
MSSRTGRSVRSPASRGNADDEYSTTQSTTRPPPRPRQTDDDVDRSTSQKERSRRYDDENSSQRRAGDRDYSRRDREPSQKGRRAEEPTQNRDDEYEMTQHSNQRGYDDYQDQRDYQGGYDARDAGGHGGQQYPQYLPSPFDDTKNGQYRRDVKMDSSGNNRSDAEQGSFNGYQDFPLPQKEPPVWEKYLCCCCPKSKRGRIICASIAAIVVIVLGILAYFFAPRFPEIKVININLQNFDSGAFTFSTPNNNGNLHEMRIGLNLTMDVSTYNPNMYGLNVERIDLTALMMVNLTYVYDPRKTSALASAFPMLASTVAKTGSPPLASQKQSGYYPSNSSQIGTSLVSGIFFPSKTWINYTMIFALDYTPDPYVGVLKDPTVMEIADACGITSRYSPPGRPMKIHYDARTTIPVLKPIGYAPSVTNDISIACPIQQAQIEQIINAVQSGQDPVTALKNALSSPIDSAANSGASTGAAPVSAPVTTAAAPVVPSTNAGVASQPVTTDAAAAPPVAVTTDAGVVTADPVEAAPSDGSGDPAPEG